MSLVDVGDFLFNPLLILIVVGRGILQVGMILVAAVPIYLFATGVYPSLKPQTTESSKQKFTNYCILLKTNPISGLSAPYPTYTDYNDYGEYAYTPVLDKVDVASSLDTAMANIIQSIVV